MKKKLALIGAAVGVAGGLIYALESQRRQHQSAKGGDETDNQPPASKSSGTSSPDGDNRNNTVAAMAKVESGASDNGETNEHVIDDHGTVQSAAAQILRSIRDQAFDASDEKLALALGRPTEEIAEWTSGNGLIDGDVLMKARTLGMQRGFET